MVLKKWEARITVFENHADFLFAGIPTQSVRIDGCFILPSMTKMENESNLKNL
ncbi:hypothetical protein [Leptospira santarosai]|uniref:hypothetical protein n=1 Tax=Leptospira santarosai TaxID=28183 RepID=UPI0018AD2F3F|nr:hypothetical protein [Leptospira santarosai]